MKFCVHSAALYSFAFAGLLALSACGKHDSSGNAPADTSGTSTPPAATATAAKTVAPVTPAPANTAATPASAKTVPSPSAPAPVVTTPTAAAPPPTTAPAAGSTGELKVSSLTVGDSVTPDHKVSKAKSTFAPSVKKIYASVTTEGSISGSATLNAKWSYLDKNQTVLSTGQMIKENPVLTTFTAQNPNAWPEGKYKVEIFLDGKSVASQEFEIKKR